MQKRQVLRTQSLESARAYAVTIENPTPRLLKLIDELDAAMERRGRLQYEQQLAKVNRGAPKTTLANAIKVLHRGHLRRVAGEGRELLAGFPGIERSLKLPLASAPAAEQVTAGRRIGEAVRPHRRAFIAAGFSRDFIEQLEQAIVAVEEAAAVDPYSGVARYTEKTSEVKAFVKYARGLVKRVDDEVVALLHSDRSGRSLEQWKKAKRTPKRLGRPRKKKPDE